MKNILFLLFIIGFCGYGVKAQTLQIHTKVNRSNGTSVSSHPVLVEVSPVNSGYYSLTLYTNSSGWADTSISHPGIGSVIQITTIDCDGSYKTQTDSILSSGSGTKNDTLILTNCSSPLSCSASFTYTHSITNPATINLTNTSSMQGNSYSYTSYSINYGDGISGSNPNGGHSYSQTGRYQVCMTAQLKDTIFNYTLCQSTFCDSVLITALPSPVCNITLYDSTLNLPPGHVDFSINSSYNFVPSGSLISYTLDYGDGSPVLSGNSNLGGTHSYASAGNYIACATISITDSNQNVLCSSSSCVTISLTSSALSCHANLKTIIGGGTPLDVNVNKGTSSVFNLPTGATVSYVFDMGDGTTLTGPSHNHQYSQSGTYTICMTQTVTDNNGTLCSDQDCRTVTVSVPLVCQASYTIDTVNSGNGTVYVWNNSSVSGGATSTNYTWHFGDGDSSTMAFPTHIYQSSGTYALCLSVRAVNSFRNCQSYFCDTIAVDSAGNVVYKNGTGFKLVVVDPTTVGLEDEKALNTEIYPNPATEELNIELPEMAGKPLEWIIYDVTGSVISIGNRSVGTDGKLILNVSRLDRGIYLLGLKREDQFSHHKIQIK